ncbi:MAG: hypothetical protein CMH56_04830 [Myxococcales bacterium]|nr:hypothetical protein [Myxococcales bacterium]|tara:strand:+ start:654 stop:2108 length:1455 start_codon:yes stop_codon:yes gene_type:complete
MDNSSPPLKGQLLAQVIAGVPVILLLGTWLVLFNGAQWGGLFLMLLSLGLLFLTFLGGASFLFGFLSGALSASLMAYQPDTMTGMSQAGIACAWLLASFVWTIRSHPNFKLMLSLLATAVLAVVLGYSAVTSVGAGLSLRVNGTQTLLTFMAAFLAFPLSWAVAHHAGNQTLLKQHFRWPTSFVLVALFLFSGVGLASSWTMGQEQQLSDTEEMYRAQHLSRQLGHRVGLDRVQEIRDAALAQFQWERTQQIFEGGFWRRWSGLDKNNVTLTTAVALWGRAGKGLPAAVRKMCQRDLHSEDLKLVEYTWPIMVRQESRWPCLASQAEQMGEEPMLNALAEEMVFGDAEDKGVHLGACRLRAVSEFPQEVTVGDTFNYEIKMESWLPNDKVPLCDAEGHVEVYIWGSKAKDVIPFAWFENQDRQAFREWQLPDYMLAGYYPIMANIRMPPLWKRSGTVGVHGARKGLFLGWLLVHPPSHVPLEDY